MPKIYTETDVLQAAFMRLEFIFDHFQQVYFSFSGGKDSSVMLQLANMVARRKGRVFDVLFIDMEAQYRRTIEQVERLKTLSSIRRFYHIALPIALRNAVSILQPKWLCWDEDARDLWVRPMPKDAISLKNCPFPFFQKGEEFEEFIVQFAAWYRTLYPGDTVACGIGIRADESLNRFGTLIDERKREFMNRHWTTLTPCDVCNFYPLYDWRTEDIWGAVSRFDLPFNEIYELMYKNGLGIHQQRLCQPYGDDQRNGLDQFRALEPETWGKVLNRVSGANFGNIYCRTTALGNLRSFKPDNMTWEEYAVFLLESIGLYNRDLMLHYVGKIRKFIRWYEKTEGLQICDIPGEADIKLEQRKKAISWRRIARALEKNDFYMKRLSFSQTKSDEKKLKLFMEKWSNFLNDETDTDDKDLNQLLERMTYDGSNSDGTNG